MGGLGCRSRWRVLVVVCCFVFMSDYSQFQASAYATNLLGDMNLSSPQLSAVMFAPYLPAIIFGLPFGALGDRYGAKRIVGISFAITVTACFLRSICSSFATLFLAFAAMGIGSASLNSNLVKILGERFGERTDFAMGCYYACGSAGIASSLASAVLFPTVSFAFVFSSVVVAFVLVCWVLIMDNLPAGRKDQEGSVPTVQSIVAVSKSRSLWTIALLLGVGLAATTAFSGYLMSAFELSMDAGKAGSLAAMFTWGSIAGCILGPLLREAFKSYKVFAAIATVLGSVAIVLVCYTIQGPSAVLLFCAGMLTAASGPIFQGLPHFLLEIHGRFEGGAGGLISVVSLALTYLIPIAVFIVCGDDLHLLLYVSAALVPATLVFIALLPSPETLVEDAPEKRETTVGE